jgi:ABC-type Fe3+ transport system permease subunit
MSGRTAARPPAGASARPRADRLALSAMIAGIVAFLCGVLPVLGLILGGVGVVLGVLAKRRSNRPELGLTALILSSLAVLTNLVVDVIVIVSIVNQANNLPG